MILYLFYFLHDAAGNETIMPLHVARSAWEAGQVQAYSDQFAPLLDAVVGGQIAAAKWSVNLSLPSGLKSSPYPDAAGVWGGLLSFEMDSGYKESLRLPTIDSALIEADFTLDTAAPALADFITALLDGLTVGSETATVLSDREESYAEHLAARLSFRHEPGIEVIGTSPEDDPLAQVEINPAWLTVLIGLAEELQDARWWAGDAGGLDLNQRHVDELLYALAAALPVPTGYFRLNISTLDSVEVLG